MENTIDARYAKSGSRFRQAWVGTLIVAGGAAVVGAVSWLFDESATSLAATAFAFLMICLAPFVRRFGSSIEFVGHLVCGMTVFFLIAMGVLFGNYDGLAPYSLPAVSALAFFLTGMRGALIWTILPLLSFTFMVLFGDLMPQSLRPAAVDTLLLHATVVTTSAGVLGVSWGFEKREQRRNAIARTAQLHAEQAREDAEQAQEDAQRALEQAKLARKSAELASNSKSAFLAAMSHEIRTPLNALIGAAQLLRDAQGDERELLLDTIQQSGVALVGQVGDVLDFSKVEAGELQVVAVPCAVVPLANQVLAVFRTQARDKGLHLILDLDGDIPAWVELDIDRLRQILLNLVGNAVKFTVQGSVRLTLAAGNGRLRIVVQDTGPGVPVQDRARIFEPFRQVEEGLSRSYSGYGLGLAISRRLSDAMGGSLALDAAEVGCRFVLELPALVLQEAEHADAPEMPENLRVLLVEDNPVNRMVASAMLKRMGVQVRVAENGAVALQVLAEHTVDIVLMDLQMPVMDGLAATRAIRNMPRLAHLPVVVLSANAFAEDRSAALASGASDFLSKPVQQEDLAAAIRRHGQVLPKAATPG